ncbi:MAG: nucleoside hydrolase, partial [Acidimicrobiales bacterium]
DPHATHVMYTSGVPIVAMPLDVTHKALMSADWIQSVGAIGGDIGTTIVAMLSFYERYDMERYGDDGGPLHDPATIAYLLQPDLYRGKDVHVQIETQSELTMGMTVVDYWHATGQPPNCKWISEVDSSGFFTLLHERLSNL